MKKKKNAIMIADTRPALIGNLLIQLKDTNDRLFDEAIIYYYDKIDEKDKKIIEDLIPCRFIKFNYKLPDNIKALPAFEKFSPLMFSRYYMFDLLNEYETITWLDTDVLICGKLDSIIDKAKESGMSANFEDPKNKSYKTTDTVRTSFKIPISNYDMTRYNMSSGLITVADTLKDYDKMTKWCFDKTIEYAENLVLPDQGILNILIQEFNVNVTCVGENGAYCFYPSYKRDASNAKIVHAWGTRKFWKSWYLFKTYPKWYEYYKEWLKLGGSDCLGEIKPDVSIIIPMYKPKVEYFKQILDDLLIKQEQEHGFQYDNFEIILVVDGNENDELINLLKKYDDPRVNLIINEERAGIAKSLNIGIKNAKADYIARIDDDDRIAKNRLYKQVKYLNEHSDIDLVTSNFEYFGDMNEERISFEGEMAHAWSIFTCPFNHPTIMFRKKFFIENNLWYDESRSHVEDWELWLRCFDKGMKVGSIPEVLYYHRWHAGSAGQNKKTIDMMRDLVKKNFAKLDINLTEEDLKIVAPWNGKVGAEELIRLNKIFSQALKNNYKKKIYNSRCLNHVFDLRLFEAEHGYMKDIVIKKSTISSLNTNRKSLKQKILGPIYRPFKRVFYNIMAEAVNDNLSNQSNQSLQILKDKSDILINNFNNKEKLLIDDIEKNIKKNNDILIDMQNKVHLLHDQMYDFEKKYDFLRDEKLSNLYFAKKIILIGTSEHSNIGDAAITYGEYEFIRKYFKDYKLIEVSTYEFSDTLPYLENIINNDDLIFLQGGGNLGNKFKNEENVRRIIIENFPNNKIIILPQTIYFNDDKEFEISKEIYNKHHNLTIFTRGHISLEIAKKNFFNAKCYESLDLALNLNFDYGYNRNGIMCCLRDLNDESGLDKNKYEEILKIIKSVDNNYSFTNNLWTTNIKKIQRNYVVYEQLKNFARHKLVVTDRLHGLIFSLITNTPCIVISAFNHKLKEFTEMLKDNKSIIFIDKNIDKLPESIDKFLNKKNIVKNEFSKNLLITAKIILEDNNK